jgi:hypothetical protein
LIRWGGGGEFHGARVELQRQVHLLKEENKELEGFQKSYPALLRQFEDKDLES